MKHYLLAFFCFFTTQAISQIDFEKRDCGVSESDERLKSIHTGYKNILDQADVVKNLIKRHSKQRIVTDTLIVPIIFHVVHNGEAVGIGENISPAQIYSQIDVINEDFQKKLGTAGYNNNVVGAGLPIKFLPAAIDTNGNVMGEPGIDRVKLTQAAWDLNDIETILKPATQWNPKQYLNIWVVTFGGSMTTKLGYAQLPDFSSLSGISMINEVAITDGVVIRYNVLGREGNVKAPYNKGRTLTHELGHFFGLLHVWGSKDSNSDCTQDDGCEDTPKTKGPLSFCAVVASCELNTNSMKENYLDYTPDACMNIFTLDQKDRMMVVLNNSPRRKELLVSKTYINPNVSGLDLDQINNGFSNLQAIPNPFDDQLIIKSKKAMNHLQLVNIQGNKVDITMEYNLDHTQVDLFTKGISSGFYLIKIEYEDGSTVIKVSK